MKQSSKINCEESHLSDKELRFANYYLGEANLNATEAAKLAGYSPNTARQQGSRMLTNVNIKKYIQSKSSEILESIGVTQEKVLAEIVKIAFADITDFFNDDWSLKQVSEIPKEKSAAIKSLRKTETGVSILIHDKEKALSLLWELVKDDAPTR
ncbi:terminase small subunit [Algoriphagus lutimaris]|uniref:terminase small subunit n=1 Tax=Algoriphagus lutimaris TaxID=613197 RepID=UPI00196A3A26|nr:terminase small subunit [Algoriphagus lutimaris]MBN3520721.1 terminase small subunit [Algoriphagus lutimaris]